MRNHFSRHGKNVEHKSMYKKLNKKGNRENGVFFDGKEKTEKESFAAVSKSYIFFGTVSYIKKHQDNKKTKKKKFLIKGRKK